MIMHLPSSLERSSGVRGRGIPGRVGLGGRPKPPTDPALWSLGATPRATRPNNSHAMICWSSSASWVRARTNCRAIDGTLELDVKSSRHFPSRRLKRGTQQKAESDTLLPQNI